jgi:hypothetical protein
VSGHGHVTPNPDGSKARCGGPSLCPECARETGPHKLTEREIAASIALDSFGLVLVPFSKSHADGALYGLLSKSSTNESAAARRARGQRFSSIEHVEAFVTRERMLAEIGPQAPAASLWRITQPGASPRQVRTTPYVGQSVHYRSLGSAGGEYPPVCRAAIVTEILPETAGKPFGTHRANEVGLCVLNPEGQFFKQRVQFDPGTYRGGERAITIKAGELPEALPLITCDQLEFAAGTWHFIAHPEAS